MAPDTESNATVVSACICIKQEGCYRESFCISRQELFAYFKLHLKLPQPWEALVKPKLRKHLPTKGTTALTQLCYTGSSFSQHLIRD